MALLRSLAALVAAALLTCSAASAAHLSKPRATVVVKRTKGAAAIDGSRYAAWAGPGGRLAVLDERSGSRALYGLGRECDYALPISGGGGIFLVECSVTGAVGVEYHQYLFDAVRGTSRSLDDDDAGFSQVGSQWLEGSGEDRFGQYVVYRNWRTDETITQTVQGGLRVPYDLDSPGLDAVAPAARNFVVGGSYALERVGRTIRLAGWGQDERLYGCSHDCTPVSVTGGLALWTDGDGKLYGDAPATGRRYAWRLPEAAEVRGSTGRRVYYLLPLEFDPPYFALKSFRWR